MYIMRKLATILSFMLAISVAQAQPVNTFVIDTFDNTTGTASDPTLNGSGVWSGYGPAITDVLGGNRVLGNYLTEVSGSGPFTNATNIQSGVFSIDNPFNTRSSGQVIWQGNATTPGTNPIISNPASFGLSNINFDTLLSTSGFYFQWSVINADSRDWTYTVRAYTNDASNYFEGTITSNLSGVNLSIAKANMVAVGSPSWTDIDALSFSANYTGGLLGGDLAIDFFQLAVPEMSTYLMLGLMLVLFGAYRAYFAKPVAKEVTKDETEAKVEEATPVVALA
jgi:hypothetical protein